MPVSRSALAAARTRAPALGTGLAAAAEAPAERVAGSALRLFVAGVLFSLAVGLFLAFIVPRHALPSLLEAPVVALRTQVRLFFGGGGSLAQLSLEAPHL